jgi:hypothetical protein
MMTVRAALSTVSTGTVFQTAGSPRTRPAAALVSVTVTASTLVFTDARCVCRRLLMKVPGLVRVLVREIPTNEAASGLGRVVHCPNRRCRRLCEVIEEPRDG